MFSLVRKVVAGPKRTTIYEGQELDLTYITERVIAMAYPASDLIEKTYRNSIEDVAQYFQQTHPNNYLIVNVSCRTYDYSLFRNRVKDYEWPDHQAPPFTTLIRAAYDMYQFLSEGSKRVVAVHCNHGKGRTGTAIIVLMLMVGFYRSAKQCLKFYNSKRFNKSTYGVDQPCQVRYLSFIEHILSARKIDSKLVCYRLKEITQRGLDEDYYMNITLTRSQEMVYEKIRFGNKLKEDQKILLSDVFIELFHENWSGKRKVARINYNLYFLEGETKLKFKGEQIKIEGGHSNQFEITLHLQYYCLCHLPIYQGSTCQCKSERIMQQNYWGEMIQQIRQCKFLTKNQSFNLLYSQMGRSPKSNKLIEYFKEEKHSHRSLEQKMWKNRRQEKFQQFMLSSLQKKIIIADQHQVEDKHLEEKQIGHKDKEGQMKNGEMQQEEPVEKLKKHPVSLEQSSKQTFHELKSAEKEVNQTQKQ